MKSYYFLSLVAVLLYLACSCQKRPKKKSLSTQKGAVVISNTAHLKNFLQIKNARFLESNKEEIIPYNLPQKVIRWSDSYLYFTLEQYQAKSKLLLFDQNWSSVQGVIEPGTGGPDSVREITDFFVLDDQLYIYDFQSQKYLIFDKGLELKEEIRTAYYFRNIIPLDSIFVAYTGRMSQLINEQEFSYDLIILDKKLEPIKYVMPFKKELVQGVTFHYSRPLLKNSSHVFYTAWWRDTVTTITGSAEVEDHFFFDYGEQTIPTFLSKKSHSELLEDMKQNKFDSYQKGASPMIISDSQMIFNFGNKDRIGYGLYDKSEGQTYVFDDYRPSPQEQLLTPVMFEDENFYSIVYPYELRKYIDSGLVSESDFKISFLEELENQPEDGKPILVKFQLSDSK